MKYSAVFFLCFGAIFVLISCKKKGYELPSPPPAATSDARSVKLKEVDIDEHSYLGHFYQYNYDADNYVTKIRVGSMDFSYDVVYENKRVKKMITPTLAGHDTLYYFYKDGNVSSIDIHLDRGGKNSTVSFTYDVKRRLTQFECTTPLPNGTILLTKKCLFDYAADGNLSRYREYLHNGTGLSLETTREYSLYDNKTNVEESNPIRNFFEHYLFLPQVVLQKNNPGKETVREKINDFDIDHTYTYNGQLTVEKISNVRETRGSGAGMTKRVSTTYTYF